MKDTAAQLDSAASQIGGAAGQQAAKVDEVLDGGRKSDGGVYAPAFVKSVSSHVQMLPGLFGKKSFDQILGVGEVPTEARTPGHVHLSLNMRDPRSFKYISPELKEMVLDLKKELHNAFIQQMILARKTMMPVSVLETPYFKHVVEPKLKAFNLTDYAAWVPTLNLQFFFEELELDPVIDRFFPVIEMGSKTVTVNGTTSRMKGLLEADTATFTAQSQTTAPYTMVAQDCVAHCEITEDLLQDIVPSSAGFERLRREVAMAVQRSKEDAIINGDDTIATSVQGDGHQDSDIAGGAATLFNKAFKGLRKRALANSTAIYNHAAAGANLAMYKGTLAKLGKNAKDKGDLLLIIGPTIGNNVVFGNVSEILTHEKFNANATLITGQLPKVFGVEQYESEWVREDVNASGVYAAAQVLTTVLAVKKSRFAVGRRAPMRIWATPSLASSDKMLMACKERFSFGGVPQSATELSVAIGRNVALS